MKSDQTVLFNVHYCMDTNVYDKIVDSMTAKAAWDTLIRCYGSDTLIKKVKLHSLLKQYKNLSMKNNEKISGYISGVIAIINVMKSYEKMLYKQDKQVIHIYKSIIFINKKILF